MSTIALARHDAEIHLHLLELMQKYNHTRQPCWKTIVEWLMHSRGPGLLAVLARRLLAVVRGEVQLPAHVREAVQVVLEGAVVEVLVAVLRPHDAPLQRPRQVQHGPRVHLVYCSISGRLQRQTDGQVTLW